jgi:hypothetical protein
MTIHSLNCPKTLNFKTNQQTMQYHTDTITRTTSNDEAIAELSAQKTECRNFINSGELFKLPKREQEQFWEFYKAVRRMYWQLQFAKLELFTIKKINLN